MTKKILIIDDDALVLKSIQNLLKRQGYEVIVSNNASDAKQKILVDKFDLVISDIRMPGQDGISLITDMKSLLQQANKPEVPFIFITGYASEEAPIDAVKLGAKDYILKPFDLDELINSVKAQIG